MSDPVTEAYGRGFNAGAEHGAADTLAAMKAENETLRKAWQNWETIAKAENEAVKSVTEWLEKLLAVGGKLSDDDLANCKTVVALIKKGTSRFPEPRRS